MLQDVTEEQMWVDCNFYSIAQFRGFYTDHNDVVNALKDMDIYFYQKDKNLHQVATSAWLLLERYRRGLVKPKCDCLVCKVLNKIRS